MAVESKIGDETWSYTLAPGNKKVKELTIRLSGKKLRWELTPQAEITTTPDKIVQFRVPLLLPGQIDLIFSITQDKVGTLTVGGAFLGAQQLQMAGPGIRFTLDGAPAAELSLPDDGRAELTLLANALRDRLEALPGHAALRFRQAIMTLVLGAEKTVLAWSPVPGAGFPDGAAADLLPGFALDLELYWRDASFDIGVIVQKKKPGKPLMSIAVGITAPSNERLPIFELTRVDGLPRFVLAPFPASTRTKVEIDFASFPVFSGLLFQSPAGPLGISALELLESSRPTFRPTASGFEVSGLDARIPRGNSRPFELRFGVLSFGHDLLLQGTKVAFTSIDCVPIDTDPFSVILYDQTTFTVDFGRSPSIEIAHPSGVVGKVIVPGRPPEEANDPQTCTSDDRRADDRFVLEILGGKNEAGVEHACRLSPDGADLTARILPRAIDLGPVLEDARADEGRLTISRGEYQLALTASANLPYFQDARGKLTVTAGSANESRAMHLQVRFDVQLTESWRALDGVLELRKPAAWVTLSWEKKWKAAGGISGTLCIKRPKSFSQAAAEDWMGELFDAVELDFHDLNLQELADVARGKKLDGLKLNLRLAKPIEIEVLKLIKFRLNIFGLHKGGIRVGGTLAFNKSGLSFEGSLPRLVIGIEGGSVKLGLAADDDIFEIFGALTLPSGTRAELQLQRERSATQESLAGMGSLLVPGIPEVRIASRIGRAWDGADPFLIFFLFAEVDYPVTLFPGVVLRHLGLGFGVNQALRGFDSVLEDGAAALEGMTMPNPSTPADWVVKKDGIALVARTFVAPSPAGEGPFPYLADAVFGINEDLSIVFFSSLWLFTSTPDARTPDFRRKPLAKGFISLYPRHKRLEARYTTVRGARSSVTIPLMSQALEVVHAEMSLLATPDIFRMRVGPMTVNAELAGFQVRGQSLFAIEASSRGVAALLHVAVAASFEQRFGFNAGIVKAELALWGRLATELLLAGGVIEGRVLYYGRAMISVAAGISLHLEIGFSITFKIFGRRITISWSIHFTATLSVAFEARAEFVLGTSIGLNGHGSLVINVFGFRLAPAVHLALGDTNGLEQARKNFSHLLSA